MPLKSICVRFEQDSKAYPFISETFLPIVISLRFFQFENAPPPIVVTPSDITTFSIFSLCAKAYK